ncbi:hypothetical protein IEQ34_010639 [Dendrobium chrysotoxum]|uniref:Uncharacterized protein n=1 Tax=Dendrobium chrysotoxum TaxID=161865 RepID=A0AAV7GTB9_DENCH|nr:hypothetical protein IEQ34_010639 [Dendrobium chrysotoxum]
MNLCPLMSSPRASSCVCSNERVPALPKQMKTTDSLDCRFNHSIHLCDDSSVPLSEPDHVSKLAGGGLVECREVEHERKEEIVGGYKKITWDAELFYHGKEVASEEVKDDGGDAGGSPESDEDFTEGRDGVGYGLAYAGDEVSVGWEVIEERDRELNGGDGGRERTGGEVGESD